MPLFSWDCGTHVDNVVQLTLTWVSIGTPFFFSSLVVMCLIVCLVGSRSTARASAISFFFSLRPYNLSTTLFILLLTVALFFAPNESINLCVCVERGWASEFSKLEIIQLWFECLPPPATSWRVFLWELRRKISAAELETMVGHF